MRLPLYGKLALVLLVILGGVGLVSLTLTLRTAEVHARKVRQQLNRDVARHIAEDLRPFAGGAVDGHALKALFMDVMRINPALEVYLLDEQGQVLMFDAPPERVVRRRVDLGPVRRFLEAPADELVLGDDPRSASRRKVISAWPVQGDSGRSGFLYLVVGGEELDSIAGSLESDLTHRASAWIALVSLALAAVIGLLAFARLTRPLRRLQAQLTAFEAGHGGTRACETPADEIGALGSAFNRMADRIRAQLARIRAEDERRRELIASISHDLRTPIANLQGFLETKLIKEQDLSREEHVRFTEIALRDARQLSALVDHLFELARLDAGDVVPQIERFSLAELAHDVAQEMTLRAREKQLDLRVRTAKGLPDVAGDIGLLQRVLVNLVANAIRYTDPGGFVRVTVEPRGDGVELSVTDNGMGIPAAELPRVFDAFYRVEKSRNEDAGGTGLGLAIARRILELHGSVIRVRSRERVGTRIAFVLAA